MDGHFPHEHKARSRPIATWWLTASSNVLTARIDSTFVGRPYAWPAISRVVDFASPGLILNEKRCGGAAMAERSNWTTP